MLFSRTIRWKTSLKSLRLIAANPPLALRLDKHMLNRAAASDLAAALDLEAYSQALALTSEDHAEGVAAFLEKRAPRFTGR